jgi:hypothetical protein
VGRYFGCGCGFGRGRGEQGEVVGRRLVGCLGVGGAALAMSKDLDASMLEQLQAEDREIRLHRKIPKAKGQFDRRLRFHDRLTSATGHKLPYLIGSVDMSLVWLADKLSVVNTEALVASVDNAYSGDIPVYVDKSLKPGEWKAVDWKGNVLVEGNLLPERLRW